MLQQGLQCGAVHFRQTFDESRIFLYSLLLFLFIYTEKCTIALRVDPGVYTSNSSTIPMLCSANIICAVFIQIWLCLVITTYKDNIWSKKIWSVLFLFHFLLQNIWVISCCCWTSWRQFYPSSLLDLSRNHNGPHHDEAARCWFSTFWDDFQQVKQEISAKH